MDLFEQSGASFSPCGTYRYTLWRRWSFVPPATFVLLNPSTADATRNDPTVERCERRARELGCGGIRVANLFALRSTDPALLNLHPAPIGPENDAAIAWAIAGAGIVICGWGNEGALFARGATVLRKIRAAGVTPHCLRLTQTGQPGHPLYVRYAQQPFPIPEGAACR